MSDDRSADAAADEALHGTAEQERRTSLEGETEERTVEELAEGAERAAKQPGFGREGS